MATKFADVSAYQPSNQAYFQGLKDDGAKFCWVKTTEGNFYVSSAAGRQIRACKNVFGSVGVYHFWHGESAAFFLAWLREYAKYIGFKLSDVKVALDVEATDLPTYVTSGVNSFETQLVKAGIKPGNIWTYISASWVSEGRFNPSALKYGFVWTAEYLYSSPYLDNEISPNNANRPKSNAWQFSGLGSQDWSYDYTGTLGASVPDHKHAEHKEDKHKVAKPNKKVTKKPVKKDVKHADKPKAKPVEKPHYANHPSYYMTSVDKVGVYADFDLKHKLATLPKNYTFYGEPVINGNYTRLLTRSGNYVTGNLHFIKLG